MIAAIIQARMASTRLPGKVLADVNGQPMLHLLYDRTRRASKLGQVVIATSVNPADDAIEAYCRQHGILCSRGSEDDVLDRFYRAAQQVGADTVVRLTADCPLHDPLVIDHVIEAFEAGTYDYVSNTLKPTYPDGVDTEVIRFSALEQAWSEASLKSEREHVTPFLYKHPERFRLLNVESDADHSGLRWTVDTPTDLEFVRAVYRELGSRPFGMQDVLELLRRQPNLGAINSGQQRNEGYAKSLREDGTIKG